MILSGIPEGRQKQTKHGLLMCRWMHLKMWTCPSTCCPQKQSSRWWQSGSRTSCPLSVTGQAQTLHPQQSPPLVRSRLCRAVPFLIYLLEGPFTLQCYGPGADTTPPADSATGKQIIFDVLSHLFALLIRRPHPIVLCLPGRYTKAPAESVSSDQAEPALPCLFLAGCREYENLAPPACKLVSCTTCYEGHLCQETKAVQVF